MKDAIIIGTGPAGAQAAIYLTRAGFDTLVIYKDMGALEKAENIENYYGLVEPVSGVELLRTGLGQLERLGCEVVNAEVTSISPESGFFTVGTPSGDFQAKALLLATGKSRKKPAVTGLEKFEGSGVSYCAVCDGFFYKNKALGVLGHGEYALSEARELSRFTENITIFTDGKQAIDMDGFPVVNEKISAFFGQDRLGGIELENGEKIPLDGAFIALGTAGGSDFARKLGIATENGKILTDDSGMTNAPGIFAAGDCAEDIFQISAAVGSGARAGLGMIRLLKDI